MFTPDSHGVRSSPSQSQVYHVNKPAMSAPHHPQVRSLLVRAARGVLPALVLALGSACLADTEVSTPDGRRVLLKDDGTWRYVDAKDKAAPPAKPKQEGEAVLTLQQKIERGAHCRVAIQIVNNLPYEIRNIIPYLSAYRASGAMHETVSIAFHSVRPGDTMTQAVDFSRITCSEIARVQVTGGDRCDMGELHRFSEANGQCLARVRVAPSELARFDK